ncbi:MULTISPECIES: flavodoxin [Methylomonas]|uniref:Flavodoxin n=2 Tax=Methylomonas TaxID=416 RepID=A0A126T5Z7_9GAMM|nr:MULTISPECIES: flavodoxin [Methylomonas]AMK77513.1 flavodoxin [Methylomonas denitrificans]OAI05095.1 flavodoxin [Methylomonas methanica]TCV84446.1 flavodoxin I [Methylomonas methanica]
MAKVGIFFGTDTGNTRKVAKTIATKLGDAADKPVNINKASVDDLLAYDVLILGSPTYGEGELPGMSAGHDNESWEEFLPTLAGADFTGKTVAIYGLGDQEGYPGHFVDAVGFLYDAFADAGATIVGMTSSEGYTFKKSKALLGDQFVGLALDEDNQKELSEGRLSDWLASISAAWA